MTEAEARAQMRLAELQRDEALRTLASVRDEMTRAQESSGGLGPQTARAARDEHRSPALHFRCLHGTTT